MRFLFITLFLLASSLSFSQEAYLIATHADDNKSVQLIEGKRIRVRNNDGERYSGKWYPISTDSIMVGELEFALSDLSMIKKHPLLYTVAQGIIFVAAGTFATGGGLFILAFSGSATGIPLVVGGAAVGYAGMTGMNILKGYKTKKGWVYSLSIPDGKSP